MTIAVAAALLSICVAAGGCIIAGMFVTMMIGEVNRGRQDSQRESYIGFTLLKAIRIHTEYRSLYPDGRLHIHALWAFACAALGTLGAGVALAVMGFMDSR